MAKALTLAFVAPLITTALSPIFLGEKVGFRRWSAVIIGFIGSLIVIRPGFIEFNLATVAALGTGFFYGIYLVITRKLHTSDSPLLTLLLTGVVGALIGSFIVPTVWVYPTINQWSLLALMGIFACLGHLFLILSLKYADASKLAPFGYFEIVTNIMLGYYFFGDFRHPIAIFSANFQRNVDFFEDSENLEGRLENASSLNCFLFSQLCAFFFCEQM